MTDLERVARVICRAEHVLRFGMDQWRPGELDAKVDQYWPRHLPAARAAITALREPSDAMIQAGQERGNLSHIVGADITDDGWVGVLKDGGARSIFRAMIDAILSDPQP